jgi:hypothetical protein
VQVRKQAGPGFNEWSVKFFQAVLAAIDDGHDRATSSATP